MLWASRWSSRQSPFKKMFFLWCSVSLLKGLGDDNLVDNEVARYSGEGARDLVHQLKLLCDPVKGCTGSLPDWKRYLTFLHCSMFKGYFRWWQVAQLNLKSQIWQTNARLGFAASSLTRQEVFYKTVSPFVSVSDREPTCEPTYVSASSL